MIGTRSTRRRNGAVCQKTRASTHGPRVIRFSAALASLFCLLLGLPSVTHAHDARPLSVDIARQGAGIFLVRLRVPPTIEPDNVPSLAWPDDCRVVSQQVRRDALVPSEATLLRCAAGLEGRLIGIRYPLYNPSLSTLFRFSKESGSPVTEVVTPDVIEWRVPKEPRRWDVALSYVRLGIEHIWKGWDHLLFVFGLLLLAGTPRRVLLAVTGFTVAHSVTLSLSTLGIVRLELVPVEAAIALSILFVAREIARPNPQSFARRFPAAMSCLFGLLHGFGFAAALREVGLPPRELAVGLLSFNLGVELGQLVFIACAAAVLAIARRVMERSVDVSAPGAANVLAAGVLGIPAAFWFFQRLAGFV